MSTKQQQQHTSRDLKGVQIDHSMNDLQEGHEYIMTFKDTHVIVQDNEDEDNVLENIELQSSFKQKMLQRRKAENATSMDQEKRVLPQYDEDEEEQENKRKARITLAGDGGLGKSKEEKLEQLREKLSICGKTQVSLDVQKVSKASFGDDNYVQNVVSDYLSVSNVEEESTNLPNGISSSVFKKPRKGLVGKKRAAEEDIMSILESRVNEESGLGTKEQKQRQLENERQLQERQAQEKYQNFENATQPSNFRQKRLKVLDVEDEDEYSLIENQLEKQRRLKLKEVTNQQPEAYLKKALDQTVPQTDESMPDSEIEIVSVSNHIGQKGESIQSVTQEFSINTSKEQTGLTSQLPSLQQQSFSLSQAKGGFTSVVNVQLPSQRLRQTAKLNESRFLTPFASTITNKEEEKKSVDAKVQESIKEDAKEEEDEVIQSLQEHLVGKGIGFALKIFRERGMLNKVQAIGRNKEKSIEDHLKLYGDKKSTQEDDRVKLKYFDKRGKELKGKEAFRQMCWKFHGKMPSHRKQEKMRQKEEVETKKMLVNTGVSAGLSGLGALGTPKDPKKSLGSLGSLSTSTSSSKKPKKI